MTAPTSDKAGVRQTIRALRNADHVIYAVEDGASEVHKFDAKASEDDIIAEVMSCDDGYLLVRLPDGTESHVYFVFGNDPEEVVCDHGVSLSPVLDPLTESWWTQD
jgi:ABC-type Zn uptake system ZnuABC Zn-binding protein ZnuA